MTRCVCVCVGGGGGGGWRYWNWKINWNFSSSPASGSIFLRSQVYKFSEQPFNIFIPQLKGLPIPVTIKCKIFQSCNKSLINVAYSCHSVVQEYSRARSLRQDPALAITRHEKSPLPRIECVVKGFVKATFARIWWLLTCIKDHLWKRLCHPDQRR